MSIYTVDSTEEDKKTIGLDGSVHSGVGCTSVVVASISLCGRSSNQRP